MGKLIFKIAVMLIIVVGMSNYVMYIMTGKSPFSFSGNGPSLPNAPSMSDLVPAGKQTAYKWTDANGVVHYSSEPPPEGQQATELEVDPNANLIQGLREAPADNPAPAATPEAVMPQGHVYDPRTIQKLMDDAKQVQETLNERYEGLEEL